MNSVTIRVRLLVLAAALLLPAIVGGTLYVQDRSSQAREAESIGLVVRFSTAVGGLVHELQKERGTTAVFIGSKGQSFGPELKTQRSASDAAGVRLREAAAGLGDAADAGLRERIERATKLLDAVPAHRAKVDGLTLDGPSSGAPYTQAIAAMLGTIEHAARSARDPSILKMLLGYVNLLQGKENAGQERAAGGGAFAAGRFDGPTVLRFGRLAGAQEAYLGSFLALAPESVVALHRAGETKTLPEVARLRAVAVASVASGSVEGVTGPAWFAASTLRIDALKSTEDAYAGAIIEAASSAAAAAKGEASRASVALPLGALAAIAFSFLLIRSINGSLTALRTSIADIAETGDLSRRAKVDGKDEVAETATAFNALVADIGSTMTAINATMEKVAESDLRARVDATARGDTNRLKMNINRTLDAVAGSFGMIASSIRQIATATEQTTAAIDQVARGAHGQVNALRQVAVAIDQTTMAVTDVTDNARRTSEQARLSGDVVAEGAKQIEAMVGAVDALSSTSTEIGEISGAISRIAGRTGLLSLNASIEAANSGGDNRGFAVVAVEVGKLAENSEKQARQIEDLVAKATGQIVRTATLTRTVKNGMDEITAGVRESSSMAASIAAAMEEQQATVTEIRASTDELNRIAQTNAAASEQIASTMTELATLTRSTNAELGKYRF